MRTVLLVEDEVFVRESVRNIIRWEELGFRVIGEAGDGAEALEKIRLHRPDLVICDIIMPEMNGVELLRTARNEGFPGKFIMLSCMSDFEYVRAAMEYGASNYILKLSMNVQSLSDALEKVRREWRRAAEEPDRLNAFYESAWNDMSVWRTSAVAARDTSVAEIEYPSSELSIVLIAHGQEHFGHAQLQSLHLADFKPDAKLHIFDRWGQATLFYWHPQPLTFTKEWLVKPTYPVVHTPVVPARELRAAWRSALQLSAEFWYSPQARIAAASAVSHAQNNPDTRPVWILDHQFLLDFEQRNLPVCEHLFKRIWTWMEHNRLNMRDVKEFANEMGTSMAQIVGVPYDWQKEIYHSCSHRHLADVMRAWMHSVPNHGGATRTDHPEINKIVDYIERNYADNLSVKQLAQLVAMDEKYVSGLFKKKTGENLIAYLQKVRIERAKHYLLHSDLPVSEVGARVGFANDNYFIKIFKRFTSATPNHYRHSAAD